MGEKLQEENNCKPSNALPRGSHKIGAGKIRALQPLGIFRSIPLLIDTLTSNLPNEEKHDSPQGTPQIYAACTRLAGADAECVNQGQNTRNGNELSSPDNPCLDYRPSDLVKGHTESSSQASARARYICQNTNSGSWTCLLEFYSTDSKSTAQHSRRPRQQQT